jgi:hypothetical protein
MCLLFEKKRKFAVFWQEPEWTKLKPTYSKNRRALTRLGEAAWLI